MKPSVKMLKGIEKVIKPFLPAYLKENETWLDLCDGRNLNGVAISLTFGNEQEKEAPARFWDYCEIGIQDVRWDGIRNRLERDVIFVLHNGEINR